MPLSTDLQNNLVAALAEFVGTFMFLFFAFAGTQIANTGPPRSDTPNDQPDVGSLIYIALSFGLSLLANVFAFYRVSGGLFNPVVTLSLCLVGGLPILRGVFVAVSQLVAGIVAAGVVGELFPGPLTVDTGLGHGTSVAQGLFIEMFLTAELVLVILLLAVEKHRATYLAPLGIGFAFLLTQLAGVYFTGGSLNPARSLGPAVITLKFPPYFWIYFIGPILGALLASGFYALINILKWKEVNPGQDWDGVGKLEAQPARSEHGPDGVDEPLVSPTQQQN